jgi:branched-chain amino acid transport system permease protein
VSKILRQISALGPTLAASAVLLLLPAIIHTTFEIQVLTELSISLLALTGLNLISGYAGELSLAQGSFYGIGAYFATIAATRGMQPTLAFLLAPVAAAAVAFVVAIPSLRLRGLYFAMATLAIAVVVDELMNNLTSLTGGINGLPVVSVLSFFGASIGSALSMYYLAAILAIVGLFVAHLFLRSRMGWGLRAAKSSEPAAATLGINIFRLRVIAFTMSGAYGGFAGALEAYHSTYISPSSFTYSISIMFFVVLLIGGIGTFSGPIIGAFILYAFTRWLTSFSQAEGIIIAGVFLICLRFFPRGISVASTSFARRAIGRTSSHGVVPPIGSGDGSALSAGEVIVGDDAFATDDTATMGESP